MNRQDLIYSKETVEGLKEFFPDNQELADALDSNSGKAWDMVHEKLNELGTLYYALSKAGFPGLGD